MKQVASGVRGFMDGPLCPWQTAGAGRVWVGRRKKEAACHLLLSARRGRRYFVSHWLPRHVRMLNMGQGAAIKQAKGRVQQFKFDK